MPSKLCNMTGSGFGQIPFSGNRENPGQAKNIYEVKIEMSASSII